MKRMRLHAKASKRILLCTHNYLRTGHPTISVKLYRNITTCAILLKDDIRKFLKFWKRAIICNVKICIAAYSVFHKEKRT
jgi:hypothetical protein